MKARPITTALAALLMLLVLLPAAAGAQPSPPAPGAHAAQKRNCVYVNGTQQCLRARQRCQARHNSDYLLGGFTCRKRRLARASEAQLRQGRFVVLGRNGQPSFSTALQAFDKYFDLPGVRQRRGAVGTTRSATAPIKWLMQYRKRLTRAQRRVLDRVRSGRGAQQVIMAGTARAAQADAGAILKMAGFLDEAKRRLEAHGMPFRHPVRYLLGVPDPDPILLGWEFPDFQVGGTTCDVSIPVSTLRIVDKEGPGTAVHELTHCAQDEFLAEAGLSENPPGWVSDGSAEWTAATILSEWNQPPSPSTDGNWQQWLGKPHLDLWEREYDGLGFWALLKHQGVDPWTRIGPATKAGSGGRSPAAFRAATEGMSNLQREWGPAQALMRAPHRWDLNGPQMPRFAVPSESIADGSRVSQPVASLGARGLALNITADVILVNPSPGIDGYFQTTMGEDRILSYSLYCTKPGGCTCEGEDIGAEFMPAGGGAVGYAGSETTGGTVRIEGSSNEAYCEELRNNPFGSLNGITLIEMNDEGLGRTVAEFPTGSCSVSRRAGFSAEASNPPYTLSANIRGFDKFTTNRGVYSMEYGRGKNPNFIVRGPGGPFGNTFLPQGVEPPGGGAMAFGEGGRLFGIGMFPVFNQGANNAVMVIGALKCRYPPRRRR
jgi:hypothetical protein